MLYDDLSLKNTGLVTGLILIALYVFCFLNQGKVQSFLKTFPRNHLVGAVLLAIGFIWTFVLWSRMDLGEFHKLRGPVQMVLIIGYFAVIFFVEEFLAVRALGMLMLLLAAPLLDAAFLKPPGSRVLLAILAYILIIKGLFFVGMPYVMRDGISFIEKKKEWWQYSCIAGAVFGLIILICSFTWPH